MVYRNSLHECIIENSVQAMFHECIKPSCIDTELCTGIDTAVAGINFNYNIAGHDPVLG